MQKTIIPIWLKWMLITATLISMISVSALAYLTFDAVAASLFDSPLNPASSAENLENADDPALKPVIVVQYEDGVPITPAVAEEEVAIIPTTEPLPTLESDERQTILLMGLDRRPNESAATRTDTMILFSLDPKSNSASMMSIPRDLYVDIPNYGRERINVAFPAGYIRNGGDAAGAQLAMETVERNLGIEVDHYVLVDFNTVISVIDEFDGVTVDVPEYIYDPLYPDMNYGYDPFEVFEGVQTMEGEFALKYMRTRHGDSDFERSRRQQQVIFAFRRAVLDAGVTGLARRAPAVYQDVRNGIFTDLTLNELLSIGNAALGISADDIKTGVLDYNYVYSYTTPSGASVLILRTEAAVGLIQDLFD